MRTAFIVCPHIPKCAVIIMCGCFFILIGILDYQVLYNYTQIIIKATAEPF